eukprot:2238501-Rhodomonas_salina.3
MAPREYHLYQRYPATSTNVALAESNGKNRIRGTKGSASVGSYPPSPSRAPLLIWYAHRVTADFSTGHRIGDA